MTQEAKGVFIPFPLLAILTTVLIFGGTGLATLVIQVYTLTATLSIRDADHREQISRIEQEQKSQALTLQDLRERFIRIEPHPQLQGKVQK